MRYGGSGLTDNDFRQAIQKDISKENIFTDINIAAVKAGFNRFTDMNKGIIDLIPAAVEAVKQETMAKMKLFSSDGKAQYTAHRTTNLKEAEIQKVVELVAANLSDTFC